VGQERERTEVAASEGPTLLPGVPPAPEALSDRRSAKGKDKDGQEKDGKGKDKDGPKGPMSRSARRLRAVAAAVLMLGLAGAVAAVVVQGVKGAKPPSAASASATASPTGKAARGSGSTGRPSSSRSGSGSGAGPASSGAGPGSSGSGPGSSGSGPGSPSATPAPKPTFDPKTSSYTIPNAVLFELNSSDLRPEARRGLEDVVAALLGEKRYGTVLVIGFTDNTGTTQINMRLSRRRAESVKDFLTPLLPRAHFTVEAHGMGASNFVATNRTAAGREKNRRVQIVVPERSS
jgi:outer membrane protein OmpA-like peptidoglycan-associated protein